jgi:hypothetical protein
MPDEKIRSTKLKFKGDKTKKKRKREDGDESGSSRKRREEDDNQADDTWVQPENAVDIRGPTFLYHPSDPSPICITYDATRARIVLSALDKEGKTEDERLVDRVPSDVSQVWVTTRVAGSPTINLCVLYTLEYRLRQPFIFHTQAHRHWGRQVHVMRQAWYRFCRPGCQRTSRRMDTCCTTGWYGT